MPLATYLGRYVVALRKCIIINWQKSATYQSGTVYILYYRSKPFDINVFTFVDLEPYLASMLQRECLASLPPLVGETELASATEEA